MGTSFVELSEKGFWARDAALRTWLFCLVDEIDHWGAHEGWLDEFRDHLHMQAIGGATGAIDPDLSAVVGTDEARRAIVLELTENAQRRLERGESAAEKNLPGLADVDEASVDQVRQLSVLFRKLLRGEIETDASSPLDYM